MRARTATFLTITLLTVTPQTVVVAAGPGTDARQPAPPKRAPGEQEPAAGEQAQPTAHEPAQPSVRMWHELVYDDERKSVLLVNGSPAGGTSASDTVELWAWTGAGWQLASADGPPWRNLAAAAFDTRRDVLVVYGGSRGEVGEAEYVQLAETWEWDGAGWTQRDVSGPGPREGHGMTFDPVRGVVVLFGGSTGDVMRGDTWTWDGRAWTNAGTSGPEPRFPALLAHDGASGTVLLFGGHAVDGRGFTTFDDTWTWDGSGWQEREGAGPSGRDGARSAFDAERGQTVVFGGFQMEPAPRNMDDTWIWNGTAWTPSSARGPAGRNHHAMVYDPARRRVLLFGGFDRPSSPALPDLWEWDGTTWTCKAGCPDDSAGPR